ncbi:MAG: hypothetical protein HN509_17180 [Halobacteriovoraceae bacterium]|jgi:hypothetical protein|nr:hypothetical protein [Halobacteriovoraceae bacterium]MBT5093759.1 hypothetical protein [Halobacteriovoraceae bacterium]
MSSFKINDLEYQIASPCDESWQDMTGDQGCRFCSSCEKNVYNLSAMNELDLFELLKSDEKVCVRLYKRADGTVLTEDCPVGFAAVSAHLKKRQFSAALFCLLSIFITSFSQAGEDGHIMGKMVAPHIQVEVMGEIIAPVEPVVEPTPKKVVEEVPPVDKLKYQPSK